MRLSPLLAAACAALVVVAWFLWPFASFTTDPFGSLFSVFRAVVLFGVTLGATNVIAGVLPRKPPAILRSAIGFVIALAVGIGVSVALGLVFPPIPPDTRPLFAAAAADAFWVAVSLATYYFLTERAALRR